MTNDEFSSTADGTDKKVKQFHRSRKELLLPQSINRFKSQVNPNKMDKQAYQTNSFSAAGAGTSNNIHSRYTNMMYTR